jgi:hypothetical protein
MARPRTGGPGPPPLGPTSPALHAPMADLLADVRRVREVADVFGSASTALSIWKRAERALEHDEEVRRVANQLDAELERSPALRADARAPYRTIWYGIGVSTLQRDAVASAHLCVSRSHEILSASNHWAGGFGGS